MNETAWPEREPDGDPDNEPCTRCGFTTTGLLDDDGICSHCRYAEDGDGDE
ncbi:hypothetical protein ACIBG0_38855 [Nocardia sp. NPDC050630]|uniref:hypothetical protein n=1 Tax=Nocardia sp. NPDC050630 TaxID=3364321 RepID=UPI0037923068